MNWDSRTQGLLDELVKISAFNTRGLSPETVMSGSQPPPPMETAGFNKARDILGRASQTKTAASRHVRRALPMQPGIDRLTHQGDESGSEKAKSVAGYGLAGLGTGGAIHKAYSSMPKVFEGMNRLPGAENAIAQQASRVRNNAIGNKLMLGGAALGTGYGAYRQYVKGKQNQPPTQVKQGTIVKTATLSSPGMALKASQQVGKKKVAPSNTGPSTTTQIRGQLVGRKGIP